ncbi:MAG: hypothetical protein AAFX99_04315 [Myxococcota bacterium]
MTNAPDFVVIGDPSSRRVALFQGALERMGLPQAQVMSTIEAIDGRCNALELGPNTVVRLESPGSHFATERQLIALGFAEDDELDTDRIEPACALALELDRGRIYYPRQWFLGYRA